MRDITFIPTNTTIPTETELFFPSFLDSTPESALWLIQNGYPESAKRVLERVIGETKNRNDEIAELETENDNHVDRIQQLNREVLHIKSKLREYSAKGKENTSLIDWQAKYIDRLQEMNASLHESFTSEKENGEYWRKKAEFWEGNCAEYRFNNQWYYQKVKDLRCEIAMLKDENKVLRSLNQRMEKTIAGIKRNYGSLKREIFRLKRHNRGYAELIFEANARNIDLSEQNYALILENDNLLTRMRLLED